MQRERERVFIAPNFVVNKAELASMALDGQGHGFVAHYASELGDLTFNSKPMINTLTMLASENLTVASSISAAIERHILTVRLML